MSANRALRVLTLLEAESISGTAKAVLEMAYESKAGANRQPAIEIHVALFARNQRARNNALIRALKAARIRFSFIDERGRFDCSVLRQVRELVLASRAGVIWTNSVKSHFVVQQSGAHKLCKWVAFHHGYTSTDFKMRLYNLMDWISLRHADRVIAVCVPFVDELQKRGVHKSRIRVQHMPIRRFKTTKRESEKVRAELGLDAHSRVVLSVGRLSYEKGHSNLLKAFALLRDQTGDEKLKLIVVGDGPERSRLERRVKQIDAEEQVVFTGHRDDVKAFYGLADAFALPSYSEGTPNVLLESMAARVPVVATAVGGVPELAEHGRNALLVPADNPPALAFALRQLMQSSTLGEALTTAAEKVVDAHSPRAYFECMRSIFLEVAGIENSLTWTA